MKRFIALVALLSTLVPVLAENTPKAVYSGRTLTFYYDDIDHTADGVTNFDITASGARTWSALEGTGGPTNAVFDPSFAAFQPTTCKEWFNRFQVLKSITGMEYLDTRKVTSFEATFYLTQNLSTVDLSHLVTSNATSMIGMFRQSAISGKIDLRNFDVSKVTSFRRLFASCGNITSLDLSTWNTAKVADIREFMSSMGKLTTVYVGSKWSTAKMSSSYCSSCFKSCSKLVGGMGTTWTSACADDYTYARADGGPTAPGLFTYKAGNGFLIMLF